MREAITLNTIEDLVAQALIHTDDRYKLVEDTRWEYDDPAAGKEWLDKRESVVGKYPGHQSDEYEAWRRRDDEYDALEPKKHAVKSWSLKRDYDTKYFLSPELGALIDGVWTRKSSRYYKDRMEITGQLTLAGILKRLGRTDISQLIKDREQERKNKELIVRRNNLRKNIWAKLNDLEKYVNDYGKEIGVTPEMFQLPPELADCLREEEIPAK